MSRHFLKLSDFTSTEIEVLIHRAIELKALQKAGEAHPTCRGKTLAMVFELKSTRTRVSFETGITQLGGTAIFLSPVDTQLGRGEPIKDTARVLSQMVDIVMIRAEHQSSIDEFAAYSDIPVINGLSDELHPCQLLADLQTVAEHKGAIQNKVMAFIGDGFNMCQSYMEAASLLGFDLHVAHPEDFGPQEKFIQNCSDRTTFFSDPKQAVKDVDVVVTDVWSSLAHDGQTDSRDAAFAGFQVNESLMSLAKPDAIFMHCLPAHRGQEVNDTIMDDPRSLVWEEAGNRLHAQKALMEVLLKD